MTCDQTRPDIQIPELPGVTLRLFGRLQGINLGMVVLLAASSLLGGTNKLTTATVFEQDIPTGNMSSLAPS